MFVPKSNYFKGILFFIAIIFIFLSVGAEFLHNHSDSEFHNDCPVCIWLINLVVILSVFLFLPGILLRLESISLNILQIFISKSYQAFRHLRSPPSLV